ncbi:unnamed protein product [Linum trigynum]|uniref:Uncharacterized protein n=1 Tax=Linum trigynum TaxID=586398 RepID=A0AAV2GTD6_9ROSI
MDSTGEVSGGGKGEAAEAEGEGKWWRIILKRHPFSWVVNRGAFLLGSGGEFDQERGSEGDRRIEFPVGVRDGEGERRIQPPNRPAAGGVCRQGRPAEESDQDALLRRRGLFQGEEDSPGAVEEVRVHEVQVVRWVVRETCSKEKKIHQSVTTVNRATNR